jgi:hypothetical protein
MLSKISSLFVGDAIGIFILEEFLLAMDRSTSRLPESARHRSGAATSVIDNRKGWEGNWLSRLTHERVASWENEIMPDLEIA